MYSGIKISTGVTGALIQQLYRLAVDDRRFCPVVVDFIAEGDASAINVYIGRIAKFASGAEYGNFKLCLVDLDEDEPVTEQLHNAGNMQYEGEKISITKNKFTMKYVYGLQSLVSTDVMQAIAIHKNTLFVGYNAGHCVTFDKRTGEKLHQFDFGGNVSTNHCGNLNFGKNFFEDNSSFPALYVSGDLTNLCCYVESVTESSSTLKQKIVFDLNTYKKASGSQVVIDTERNKIVYMQRVLSSISDLSNKIFCTEFDLPALTDGVLTDGVLVVTLTDSDVITSYELPTYKGIYQGSIIHNGKIFLLHGQQNDGEGHYCGIMVFDIETNTLSSYVDMTPVVNAEPQGICVQDNNLYVNFLISDGLLYRLNF